MSGRDEQLNWLRVAVTSASITALSDRAIMAALEASFERPQREVLLREFERRLERWPTRRHTAAAKALARLHERNTTRSRASRRVDQMLVRLLHQIRGERARALARDCLQSPRLLRRRAAWTYFRINGLDPQSADALSECRPEGDRDYIRFVAMDPDAVCKIGLEPVLSVLAAFGWRYRAIESALQVDPQAVRGIAAEYPAEALVAIGKAGGPDELDLARTLYQEHGGEIEVLTAAIRCFAALRATSDLDAAVARGRELLDREQPWFSLQ